MRGWNLLVNFEDTVGDLTLLAEPTHFGHFKTYDKYYLSDSPRFSGAFFIVFFESSLLTNSTDFELDGPKLLSKSASKSASL